MNSKFCLPTGLPTKSVIGSFAFLQLVAKCKLHSSVCEASCAEGTSFVLSEEGCDSHLVSLVASAASESCGLKKSDKTASCRWRQMAVWTLAVVKTKLNPPHDTFYLCVVCLFSTIWGL